MFGEHELYFDLIYIGALSVSCIICWSDKDTLGALLILLGYWGLSKLLFFAPNELVYWTLIYAFSLGLNAFYFHHFMAKIVLAVTLFSIGTEVYWWAVEYENRPQMHYWVGLLSVVVWTRQLLFNRVIIVHNYFGYLSGKTVLDDHIIRVLYLYFVLVLVLVGEYFVRHLAAWKNFTAVYYLFSQLAGVISAITLVVIYMHYFHNQSQRYFKA